MNHPPSPSADASIAEFLDLYGQHQVRLFRYIRVLVQRMEDAEDLMQEVSKDLWKDFARFEPGTNFLAWARRIAFLRVQEFRRAANRRPAHLPDDVLEAVAAAAEEVSNRHDDRREALELCRQKLRDSDRELLEHRYAGEQSLTTIAEKIGRPLDSIYQSLRRIRGTLLECMERQMSLWQRGEGGLGNAKGGTRHER